jgi:hypothetical protein
LEHQLASHETTRSSFAKAGPDELIEKIETHYCDWPAGQLARLMLEALSAQAANGAVRVKPRLSRVVEKRSSTWAP